MARPTAEATGVGSRRTEIVVSVAATVRTTSGRIGRASETGSANPSESRASISSRHEPGTDGALTDRSTVCPVRATRRTSDQAGDAGTIGTVALPSARATGVHRTAKRSDAGRPSVRVVHGIATTID